MLGNLVFGAVSMLAPPVSVKLRRRATLTRVGGAAAVLQLAGDLAMGSSVAVLEDVEGHALEGSLPVGLQVTIGGTVYALAAATETGAERSVEISLVASAAMLVPSGTGATIAPSVLYDYSSAAAIEQAVNAYAVGGDLDLQARGRSINMSAVAGLPAPLVGDQLLLSDVSIGYIHVIPAEVAGTYEMVVA